MKPKKNVSLLLVLVAAALSVMSVTWPTATLADTYSCGDPPDKLAKVGVSSTSTVSITQDKSAKECRISVNGITVGSPPQDQVLSALNVFRTRGQTLREIASQGITPYLDSLALLLLAAAPITQVPPEVVTALRNQRSILEDCFRAASSNAPIEVSWKANVACRFIQVPKTNDEADRLGRYSGLTISSPMVEISLKWGSDRYLSRLYLPRGVLYEAPPLPQGFR